jgi:hypothetical protein
MSTAEIGIRFESLIKLDFPSTNILKLRILTSPRNQIP